MPIATLLSTIVPDTPRNAAWQDFGRNVHGRALFFRDPAFQRARVDSLHNARRDAFISVTRPWPGPKQILQQLTGRVDNARVPKQMRLARRP
jgi:hypothetical protein